MKLSHTSFVLVCGVREYVLGLFFLLISFWGVKNNTLDKLGVCHNKHNKLCSHLNYVNKNFHQ